MRERARRADKEPTRRTTQQFIRTAESLVRRDIGEFTLGEDDRGALSVEKAGKDTVVTFTVYHQPETPDRAFSEKISIGPDKKNITQEVLLGAATDMSVEPIPHFVSEADLREKLRLLRRIHPDDRIDESGESVRQKKEKDREYAAALGKEVDRLFSLAGEMVLVSSNTVASAIPQGGGHFFERKQALFAVGEERDMHIDIHEISGTTALKTVTVSVLDTTGEGLYRYQLSSNDNRLKGALGTENNDWEDLNAQRKDTLLNALSLLGEGNVKSLKEAN